MIDITVFKVRGHSSVGRAPAWHEATKSIDMTWYNWTLKANVTKCGAELGAVLINQTFINTSIGNTIIYISN